MNEIRRFFEQRVELSADDTVCGFISYWTQSSPIKNNGTTFLETLANGCFRNINKYDTILAQLNHDNDAILGSTRDGSLQITEHDTGLSFRLKLPNSALGRDVLEAIRNREIAGVSPSFSVIHDEWSDDKSFRTIRDATLFEISLVSSPAYWGTCCSVATERRKKCDDEPEPRNKYYGPARSVKVQRGSLWGR